jgi:hypothetical protein
MNGDHRLLQTAAAACPERWNRQIGWRRIAPPKLASLMRATRAAKFVRVEAFGVPAVSDPALFDGRRGDYYRYACTRKRAVSAKSRKSPLC